MAKRGEIPAEKSHGRTFVNSAPVDEVLAVKARVEALGREWHEAAEEAGVSRNVRFALLRGEGSVGSLRKVEAWLLQQQATLDAQRAKNPREQWNALADDLEAIGDDALELMADAVREYVSAEKRRRAALTKLLRVTPESKR